jgi:serine/threonine protein kinase
MRNENRHELIRVSTIREKIKLFRQMDPLKQSIESENELELIEEVTHDECRSVTVRGFTGEYYATDYFGDKAQVVFVRVEDIKGVFVHKRDVISQTQTWSLGDREDPSDRSRLVSGERDIDRETEVEEFQTAFLPDYVNALVNANSGIYVDFHTQTGNSDDDAGALRPATHTALGAIDKITRIPTLRLADFRKIADLGRGSFGTVYSAHDPRDGGVIAVRLMQDCLRNDRDKEIFLREVEILAKIEHETLVRFRGWVPPDEANPPAILTEFMPRGSLQSMMGGATNGRRSWGLGMPQTFIVLYGTAIGMMVLHQNGVLHGNLKPSNILLNDNLEAKITDFGISNGIDPGASLLKSMSVGTLPYIAPEIFKESRYSWPSDVYAFGILVYILVTLMDPFPGESDPLLIRRKVVQGERPTIPNGMRKNWRTLITKCWSQDPYDRPAFEEIVSEMGSAGFIDDTIDRYSVFLFRERMEVSYNSAYPFDYVFEVLRSSRRDRTTVSRGFQRAIYTVVVERKIGGERCPEMEQDVEQSFSDVARWYRTAMEYGQRCGASCHGNTDENGKGVTRGQAVAVPCSKQAADAGHELSEEK